MTGPPRSGSRHRIMGDHDLLAEAIVPVGAAALTLATPHADERQQRQQRVIEVRALLEDSQYRTEPADRRRTGCCAPRLFSPVRPRPRLPRRRRSRLVGDQPVQGVQRKPGDDDDRGDQQDLEEQHHGVDSSGQSPPAHGQLRLAASADQRRVLRAEHAGGGGDVRTDLAVRPAQHPSQSR